MSGLGELDRPGTPASPGAWDERSEEWTRTDDPTVPADDPTVPVDGPTAPLDGPRGSVEGRPAVPADDVSGSRPPAARPKPPRRSAVDPVKALMHRHRELCARAVDALEIAAGLEAHGVTDRTAARFRHRDVFSLAEEMYARVPRDGDPSGPTTDTTGRPTGQDRDRDRDGGRDRAFLPPPAHEAGLRLRADWILLSLLPGLLCAATVTGLRHTDGQARLGVAVGGTLAVAVGLHAALRRGPLSRPRPAAHGTVVRTCWLLAYAALGDGLLRAALHGGPDTPPTLAPDGSWPLSLAPLLTLALACAPAAWCAHLLAAGARRRLTVSRGLEEFTASVRPLLLGTFGLFLGALAGLTGLCAALLGEPPAYGRTLTLGSLLFLARLLTVHRFTRAPRLVLAAAVGAQALALAAVFAARLPHCPSLSVPVETVADAWGPALACGAAALVLLVHATRRLTRASAHARPDAP
ncbi:hypothetical protein AQJ30_21955 [Streptomyces longwoodensis]|uniref:Integral membrane protein n=1 Tax=Streptomyces longwoodensis TaxID=68231 RepID=A0A101QUA2_9ACTN|nr:hypothetical protein [Streptomyces longwoodensis]KUN36259.1 hypothetical protein AQJ30_21955 [Streptomyces longwoodensis]